MCARVFSYVRCVAASRRFRILSREAARRDYFERGWFAPANWTIERLIKLSSPLPFLSSLLPLSLSMRERRVWRRVARGNPDVNCINDYINLGRRAEDQQKDHGGGFLSIRREPFLSQPFGVSAQCFCKGGILKGMIVEIKYIYKDNLTVDSSDDLSWRNRALQTKVMLVCLSTVTIPSSFSITITTTWCLLI